MPDRNDAREGLLASIRRWLREGIVRDVPAQYSACEFDCRKDECREGYWSRCVRRLRAARDGGRAN